MQDTMAGLASDAVKYIPMADNLGGGSDDGGGGFGSSSQSGNSHRYSLIDHDAEMGMEVTLGEIPTVTSQSAIAGEYTATGVGQRNGTTGAPLIGFPDAHANANTNIAFPDGVAPPP